MIERGIIMRKLGKGTLLLMSAVMAASLFTGCGKESSDTTKKNEVYATITKSKKSTTAQQICSWIKYKTEQNVDIGEMEVSYCSEKMAVISDSVGSIVFDRKKQQVVAGIDLASIGCDNFDTDIDTDTDEEKPALETQVKVSKDEKNVIVYNKLGESVKGKIYVYSLSDIDSKELTNLKLQKTINEKDKLYKQILKDNENTKKDKTLFNDKYDEEIGDGKVNSSYFAYQWRNAKNQSLQTSAVVDKNGFNLYTLSKQGSQIKTQRDLIHWKSSDIVKIPNRLPQYQYNGEDQRIKAVFEQVKKENKDGLQGSVVIPMLKIYKIVEDEKEAKVYANFWNESYYRYGSLLKSSSGGSYPGVMHLKKTGNSYKITKVEYAQDGSALHDSILKLCKGHPGVALKMMNDVDSISDRKIKKEVRTYVKQNHLDIKAYKDSGWPYVNL